MNDNYTEPNIEIVHFEQGDILTLSNGGIDLPDDEF
mgnify:CR=1 FL=1